MVVVFIRLIVLCRVLKRKILMMLLMANMILGIIVEKRNCHGKFAMYSQINVDDSTDAV